jgi:hypothetical protein
VLVQQHAEHEGERVSTEQLVGRGVLGDAESRHTGDGAAGPSERNRRPARTPRLLYDCRAAVQHRVVAKTIGFRPTEEDERIIREAMRDEERTADVIRRALRLLEREAWLARARDDAERLADEDQSGEAAAW